MMSVWWYLFGFQGRFTAGDYWMHCGASSGLAVLTLVGITALFWQLTDAMSLFYALAVVMPVQVLAQTSATVRRLHDFGISGWWIAPYMVVLLSLIAGTFTAFTRSPPLLELAVVLFGMGMATVILPTAALDFVRGQRFRNRFGADPLREPDQDRA